jgi:hypothetical protein
MIDKAIMDCSYEAKTGIDIVNLMVSNSDHKINVVHASITTKSCRTGQYE